MARNTAGKRAKTAARLKAIINECGISQTELSRVTQINRSSICRYISAKATPSDENAEKLGMFLHVDPAWLKGEDAPNDLQTLNERFSLLNDEGKMHVLEYMESMINNGSFLLDNGDAN